MPALADWCVVDVLDDEGTLARLAVAAADPSRADLARELAGRFVPDPGAGGPARVARTGKAESFAPLADAGVLAVTGDPAYRALLARLPAAAAVCVPLATAERTFGALTLLRARSERAFSPTEVAIARLLGPRAVAAVEHALLTSRSRWSPRSWCAWSPR